MVPTLPRILRESIERIRLREKERKRMSIDTIEFNHYVYNASAFINNEWSGLDFDSNCRDTHAVGINADGHVIYDTDECDSDCTFKDAQRVVQYWHEQGYSFATIAGDDDCPMFGAWFGTPDRSYRGPDGVTYRDTYALAGDIVTYVLVKS